MAINNLPKIIEVLSKVLFEAEFRRLESLIKKLNQQNRECSRLVQDGFVYGGITYVPKDSSMLVKGPKPALAFELTQDMEEFLQDQRTIETDKKLIEQIFYNLLYQCNNLQEVRDALPECLVSLVPDLSKLPRHLNQGFTVQFGDRPYRQFMGILPKIEFYSATRLLY